MILINKFMEDFTNDLENIIDDNVNYRIDGKDLIIYLDEEDKLMESKIEILATKYCYIVEYEYDDEYIIMKLTQQIW